MLADMIISISSVAVLIGLVWLGIVLVMMGGMGCLLSIIGVVILCAVGYIVSILVFGLLEVISK